MCVNLGDNALKIILIILNSNTQNQLYKQTQGDFGTLPIFIFDM